MKWMFSIVYSNYCVPNLLDTVLFLFSSDFFGFRFFVYNHVFSKLNSLYSILVFYLVVKC